jgi:hypothetical protein
MNTQDLIESLVARAGTVPTRVVEKRLLAAASIGLLAGALAMWSAFGVRPDIETAVAMPMFWIKLTFPAVVATAGWVAVARLSRPGARIGVTAICIALPFLAVWLAAALALWSAESSARAGLMLGTTWSTCLRDIPVLALPAFVAVFWAMRGLAPTRLGLAGAAGGLTAGAIGAFVYALRCPETEVTFLAVWYVAGIAVSSVIGALLGPRALRW